MTEYKKPSPPMEVMVSGNKKTDYTVGFFTEL